MAKKPPADVTPPAAPAAPTPPAGAVPASDRTKASKLRAKLRAGVMLMPSEEDWLRAYEATLRAKGSPDFGASASEKITSTHVEERHAAVGTGDAAAHAVVAGAMVREEGKRLDALIAQSIAATSAGMTAMQRACDLYGSMAENMLADRMADREEMRTLMASIRTHYLARIDAEGAAAKAAQQPDDPMAQVAAMVSQLREMIGTGPRVVPGGKTGSGSGG